MSSLEDERIRKTIEKLTRKSEAYLEDSELFWWGSFEDISAYIPFRYFKK